jgi:hypothetical protein
MCKCLTTIPKNTLKFLQQQQSDDQIKEGKGMLGIGFLFGKGNVTGRTYNEFEYLIEHTSKNGTVSIRKKKTTIILHSFCPFCGKAYPETN